MTNKWKLQKFSDHTIDILHCQSNKEHLRISFCTDPHTNSYDKEIAFISSKYRYISSIKSEKGLRCPNCHELVPDHVLIQMRLLSGNEL